MPFGAARTTVMMPSYEAESTLRGAVDSVLSQTVGELELVVVDDGSSVPVAEVLDDIGDPRLRIIRHPRNRGLSAARNTALAAARTPLVSQLDADDLWEPDYLEAVLPRLDDPQLGLVYANCTILRPSDRPRRLHRRPVRTPDRQLPEDRRAEPGPVSHGHDACGAVRAVGGYATWLRAVRGLPPVHEARARGLALRLRPRAARPVPLARARPRNELRRAATRGMGARDVRLVRAPSSAHPRAAPPDARSRPPRARPDAPCGRAATPRPGSRPRLLLSPGATPC